MGWWQSAHGMIGDVPADILDYATEKIVKAYEESSGRPPTQGEMADLIDFCTCGMLAPRCGDPASPWGEETPKAPGSEEFKDPEPPPDHLYNVDPASGVHFHRSEIGEAVRRQEEERPTPSAGEAKARENLARLVVVFQIDLDDDPRGMTIHELTRAVGEELRERIEDSEACLSLLRRELSTIEDDSAMGLATNS